MKPPTSDLNGHGQPRVLVISASDSKYFFLLRGLIASLEPALARPNVDLACFDLGIVGADREWLQTKTDRIVTPGVHFGLDPDKYGVVPRSFLVRPFLPTYFPGYDVYFWVDSDVWIQDAAAFDHYVSVAMSNGVAAAHEREGAYAIDPRLFVWSLRHDVLGAGLAGGLHLITQPQINAGVFAIAGDAPYWHAWENAYQAAIKRTGRLTPYDQVALNMAVYGVGGASAKKLLGPEWNWICRRGVPMWHDDRQDYCKPYAPYDTLSALHLAGIGKHTEYTIKRTGGGSFETMIVFGSSASNPVRAKSLLASAG
jgi:hypothetical protein